MAQTPKFVRWAVLIGIVVALNLFFVVARSLVLPEPAYEDYCPTMVQPPATQQECEDEGYDWVATPDDPRVTAVVKPNAAGYCDMYRQCQPLYEEASEEARLQAFILHMGLGVLSIIIGVLPLGSSIVSSGLSYGGVLSLIIAAGSYWDSADNLLRLLISTIALVALLYLGWKRFKD